MRVKVLILHTFNDDTREVAKYVAAKLAEKDLSTQTRNAYWYGSTYPYGYNEINIVLTRNETFGDYPFIKKGGVNGYYIETFNEWKSDPSRKHNHLLTYLDYVKDTASKLLG